MIGSTVQTSNVDWPQTAERLAELADMAELMGDGDGAARFRRQRCGGSIDRAMRMLDD